MINLDPTTWRVGRRALERALSLYLDDPNVALIDLGFRKSASTPASFTPELAVRIHVRNGLSDQACDEFAAEASRRLGFAVEVVAATYDLHLDREAPAQEQLFAQSRYGASILNPTLARHRLETLGGRVRDRQSGEEMMLGCWHVLADSRLAGEGPSTDQTASTDGNNATASIRSAIHAGLDAAVIGPRDVTSPRKIITANGVFTPQLGMRVIKSGAGPSELSGIIAGVSGYCLRHDDGGKRLLGPLLHIAPEKPGDRICDAGDSGAWWLEASTRRAVALHFAGSHEPSFALAFPMPEVLQALEVEIMVVPEILSQPDSTKNANIAAPDAVKTISAAAPNITRNLTAKRIYQIACVGLLLAFAMLGVRFHSHVQQVHRQQQERILQLEKQLRPLRAIVQVDSTRQRQIRRLEAIIDRFNREMREELKFRIAAEIYEMSLKYHQLDVDLICATITHETGRTWNPQAISPAGALGLMQILPTTGIYLARAEGLVWTSTEAILFDPIFNLRLGCRYLDEMISNYGVEAGLAAYNGGDGQAKLWLQGGRAKQLVHAETARYVPAVLRIYEEYRR
ncbi:lytic transglycosylase domain-containing protein [candidate division KSB1 bacterium]|nr:lytic transglycosylase domain-containing protein [candidate division KSB1 bacterium]